ncbi:MAG: hypothetical protein QGH57_00735 [Candidatus Thalassarchaeaceae archaeon]|jgi:hypothetical protein|nr:hypothetical protein [Candidatus Thalassarchaeaceae archaeon]MDP7256543.1 hypothetical protein [Candidatus Thalassarchaeaceae archaeon]MDP7648672.1 hypothetical protein [Candidatus Thalassarchaeaceae archaeon]HJL54392.1 hypothetical protein [Candidatus Thalassarchaeaceae archaeon]HJM77666.1 hypothetical protein [Candidatus Thalassarchaeaceae archaeon]
MQGAPQRFEGDFSSLWRLDVMPPINRLTWWWYWVLVMVPDANNPGRSRQLMTLWSTKQTEAIRVSGHWWKPGSRMHKDEHGGFVIPGMVCAWWYDGETMHEPLTMRECRMAVVGDDHPLWPGEGAGEGAGAIVPIEREDMSLGMLPGNAGMWMSLSSDREAVSRGAPSAFEAELTPWWGPTSSLTYRNNEYSMGMGYDILRLQGSKCRLNVDGEPEEGTAYFQKVTVQAPASPWFWGMLHFGDGSYLDWFMPHVSPLSSTMDDRPWRRRDFLRYPDNGAGVFHDRIRGRTENFARCEVELSESAEGLRDRHGHPLPEFRVRIWNGRTQISLDVRAASRARWTFDQPTRGGMVSHLTYNEYPLEVARIAILDEGGLRSIEDYEWIHGNAEHAWGILH